MKRVALAAMFALAATAFAGEGMWMPQQVPQLGAELRKLGFEIDAQRFADLTGDPMGAVISLGGCTASFVSPEGLVVTNHHCAYGSIQYNSSAERDLILNGFLAMERKDELQAAPGSRVYVTTKIDDVTERVTGKLSSKLTPAERGLTMERRQRQLTDECEKPGGLRCRVSSFFEGETYLRLMQMEILDVRLVYAPAEGIGNFGGETDNWMWPRHTGDFSYYRAYVGPDGKPAKYSADNVPYRPKQWLKVSTQGVSPGDPVLVAGYPGRTYRYRTAAEVRNSNEFLIPTTIRYATELNRILEAIGKNDRGIQIKNASRIKGNDNVLKNYTGTELSMKSGAIAAQREKREADLVAWVAAGGKDRVRFAGVMERLNALDGEQDSTREREMVMSWIFRSSPMLSQAQKVYRSSIERAKKDDLDRADGYRQRDQVTLAQASQRAQSQIHVPSDRAGLRHLLLEATKLPADQRIAVLDKALASSGDTGAEAQADALLDRIYSNTKIADARERAAMYGETKAQLDARKDSMLEFAATLLQQSLASEERELRFSGSMTAIRPLYLQALREMKGGMIYPDANGTLRITFGTVQGYKPRDAVRYEPQTTLPGVVAKHTGEGEFDVPDAELKAIREGKTAGYVDPQLGLVPVNFLSNVDTTGGNSGSPTLNHKGELCGLLFDGNFEALGSDYLVAPEITRSIHVDGVYMLWVMDAVDNADHLLREMGIEPKL